MKTRLFGVFTFMFMIVLALGYQNCSKSEQGLDLGSLAPRNGGEADDGGDDPGSGFPGESDTGEVEPPPQDNTPPPDMGGSTEQKLVISLSKGGSEEFVFGYEELMYFHIQNTPANHELKGCIHATKFLGVNYCDPTNTSDWPVLGGAWRHDPAWKGWIYDAWELKQFNQGPHTIFIYDETSKKLMTSSFNLMNDKPRIVFSSSKFGPLQTQYRLNERGYVRIHNVKPGDELYACGSEDGIDCLSKDYSEWSKISDPSSIYAFDAGKYILHTPQSLLMSDFFTEGTKTYHIYNATNGKTGDTLMINYLPAQ